MEQSKQENGKVSEEIMEHKTENAESIEERTADEAENAGEKAADKDKKAGSSEVKAEAAQEDAENMKEQPEEKAESAAGIGEVPEEIKSCPEAFEEGAEKPRESGEYPEESAEKPGEGAEDSKKSAEIAENQTEQTEGKKESAEQQPDRKESTAAGEENTAPTGKAAKKKKKFLIPVGILLVLLAIGACVYSVIAFSYRDKFLPGTWINGMECAELNGEQAAGLLENQLQAYCLEVTGRDCAGVPGMILGQITAQDVHLTYSENSREAVDTLLAEQDVFTWLYRKLSGNTYSFHLYQGVSYDEEQMRNIVKAWEACRPDNMVAPQNAYISDYSEKLKGYEVVPEVEGTKFDVPGILELIDAAILSQEASLDLEAEGCYEDPAVRQDAAELTEPVETANKWLGARITYDWNDTEVVVDTDRLKDWITMTEDGPVLDEKAVAAFVKEQAEEYDTYGKRRSFVTALGVTLSLPSGYYGWLTDKEAETQELIGMICQGRTASREPVYASTARQKGMSDIGNSYVEVDLTHQHLYLYEGGSVIFETDFVSGSMTSTPDCVTPEGVFGISYKTTNAVLRGATYETPVNYWMPFYGNFGMHDATWRSEFGGQIYIENGSHGCVNLPLSSAALIYEHVSTGFPVICYYYQADPLADQYVDDGWDDNDDDDEE